MLVLLERRRLKMTHRRGKRLIRSKRHRGNKGILFKKSGEEQEEGLKHPLPRYLFNLRSGPSSKLLLECVLVLGEESIGLLRRWRERESLCPRSPLP